MLTLVDRGNAGLTALFDLLCLPLSALPPIGALAVLSCGDGVGFVWLFGLLSDQERIRAVRDRIRGNLLGVRLFRRDPGVVLRLQGRILGDTWRFLRLAAVPMLVLAAPLALVMAQLHLRFAARALAPGEAAVVTAVVRDASLLEGPLKLATPPGVTVETPPVRVRAAREVSWRVRLERPGHHRLRVQVGNRMVVKTLVGGAGWGSVPQRRTGEGLLRALLAPGEPTIPRGSGIESVEVAHPRLDLRLFGVALDWWIAFLGLSMAAGLVSRGVLGVEI